MRLFIPGPSGRLEARLDAPADGTEPRAAAVVCHPHPEHGGTMDSTVCFRAARALREACVAALRFNFPGVGLSEGSRGQDDGRADAAAALDWLAERFPAVELWAAGYSYGARAAARLALADARVRRLICIALPVRQLDVEGLERLAVPGLFLFAGDDEFGNLEDLRERHAALPAGLELEQIEGTDHLFRRQTPELERRLHRFARASVAAR